MRREVYEITIDTEMDVVLAQQKIMQFGTLVGLSTLKQTQLGTAVSEMARNTLEHAEQGRVTFYWVSEERGGCLEVVVTDTGQGMKADPLVNNPNQFSHKGLGISIAKKLVDRFRVQSSPEGTSVLLQKLLPTHPNVSDSLIRRWQEELAASEAMQSPYELLKTKNQELTALTRQLKEKSEINRQQVTEIEALNGQLKRKNQELTEFAYTLSHDLKNPLANISMLVKLARKAENQAVLLEKIDGAALTIQGIIEGLMQIIDIDQDVSTQADIRYFQDIIEKLTTEYATEITAADVRLQTDFEVASIQYVGAYLDSIIRNLVSNAIKYQAEERPLELSLTTRQQQNHVLLSVQDNGIGMDLTKHREALFQPFRRLTRQQSGKGIGLHMIKKMIEKNGGSVEVESTPGEGTTFHCLLKAYHG